MKDYKQKQKKKKGAKNASDFHTSKSSLQNISQAKDKGHMGARPRALGGHK